MNEPALNIISPELLLKERQSRTDIQGELRRKGVHQQDNPTGRQFFLDEYYVPRGTAAVFDHYVELLLDWQGRMNLVAPSTLAHVWQRHIADSAQLVALGPMSPARWIDIGSGAGFPGIVVALLSGHQVTLVESIGKKCLFLETLVAELKLPNVIVRNSRAESLTSSFDVISARACAPLHKLLELGIRSSRAATQWLLMKGENVDQELGDARQKFNFDADLIASRTDSRGRIVVARNVKRIAARQ